MKSQETRYQSEVSPADINAAVMASVSQSVVDTAIHKPDVAHLPIDLLRDKTVANAVSAIA